MNYIKQLESRKAELDDVIVTRAERMQEFREYLLSSKFAPILSDGSRGDWVGVTDVLNWLRYIESPSETYLY